MKSARALAWQVAESASPESTMQEVMTGVLKGISENPYHAFLYGDDPALPVSVDAQVAGVAQRLGEGARLPLAGVPVVVKDNLAVKGQFLGCASKILAGHRAAYTATALERLVDAGAILVGRANMDEFAMGSSTENSAYGPAKNPLVPKGEPARAPGGSSGGSAVAVASGLVPLALGSETGGSVRQPASFCGIVGFKPSYGRISRYGLVAFASSLDCIAPFGGDVHDTALVTQVMSGFDPRDVTSVACPVGDLVGACNRGIAGLKVGMIRECEGEGVEPGVQERMAVVVRWLEEAGAKVVPVSLPGVRKALACYCVLAPAEASSNLARFDGIRYGLQASGAEDTNQVYVRTRSEGFGPEVRRRILLGTFALSAGYAEQFYQRAQAVRQQITEELNAALQDVDLLLSPTSPTVAFPLGARAADPLSMYLADIFTIPASLAGLPASSVPCGFGAPKDRPHLRLPVGAQLTGRYMDEATVFAASAVIEAAWRAESTRA